MPEDQNTDAAGQADAPPAPDAAQQVSSTEPPLAPPAPPPAPEPTAAKKTRVRRQAIATTTDPATDVKTVSAVVTDAEADAPPASATLACPFGYYDDDGAAHWWHAGQVVTDVAEIADLIERGAIFAADV